LHASPARCAAMAHNTCVIHHTRLAAIGQSPTHDYRLAGAQQEGAVVQDT